MDVSKNRCTPKSSILIGFSIINHPFWDTPIFGNTHIAVPSNGLQYPCRNFQPGRLRFQAAGWKFRREQLSLHHWFRLQQCQGSVWWCWLAKLGGGFNYFLCLPLYTWGNNPIWLIFFRWVETTNQKRVPIVDWQNLFFPHNLQGFWMFLFSHSRSCSWLYFGLCGGCSLNILWVFWVQTHHIMSTHAQHWKKQSCSFWYTYCWWTKSCTTWDG